MNLEGNRQYYSIPNLLSYFRILLIPFIVYFYLYQENLAIVIILFVMSGITDALDGYIARKYNQVTQFGKVIDPIADKLTQFSVLYMLTVKYPVLWYVFVMYLIKDAIILFANYYLFKKKNLKPDGAKWYGKLCTALFYVLIAVLLLVNDIPNNVIVTVSILYTLYVGTTSDLYSIHFYKRYTNAPNVS